jgi:myo-inositol-1(or 4)-monophosphatase
MQSFICSLARDAGSIILDAYRTAASTVHHKGAIDLVTETDLASEKLIISRITAAFPRDAILSEEQETINPSAPVRWIIDPLDGTTNFAHRFPFCAVSIAREEQGVITHGVVFAPVLDELFYAAGGAGATRNNKPIHVSSRSDLAECLVATGFPYDRWQLGDEYIKDYLSFMKCTQGVRRAGAAAIDLCYLACGRFDGFFERKLKPWDTAAGSLIITESGGRISDYHGLGWSPFSPTICASNGLIHDEMVERLG